MFFVRQVYPNHLYVECPYTYFFWTIWSNLKTLDFFITEYFSLYPLRTRIFFYVKQSTLIKIKRFNINTLLFSNSIYIHSYFLHCPSNILYRYLFSHCRFTYCIFGCHISSLLMWNNFFGLFCLLWLWWFLEEYWAYHLFCRLFPQFGFTWYLLDWDYSFSAEIPQRYHCIMLGDNIFFKRFAGGS